MSLKLMYITNKPYIAQVAERCGVDRVFVDMEYIGKKERQGGKDTVQNHHTVEDVKRVRECIHTAQLMVRCNPIHERTEDYTSSAEEIEAVIAAGADIIMLPYFKTVEEVETFLRLVDGRVKTLLLVETPQAVEHIDEILSLDGIDEVFVGLNDLSLGYGKKFMFELLADGTVERLCLKFRLKGLPYGFGGIAALGKGLLPSERVIAEHYRLGSTCAILSRSFCNLALIEDENEIAWIFENGVSEIRAFERTCEERLLWFKNNQDQVREIVSRIVEGIS